MAGPTIPVIGTNERMGPQQVTGSYSMPDTSLDLNYISQIAFPNQGQAPNSTVTTSAQAPVVNVPHPNQYTPRGPAQPYDDTSQEKIRAHKSDTFRQITNAVGAYAQKKSTERTDALKTQITSVLAAQKRIGEAQVVLQNDPNNANAKAVLDSNTKVMDGILSGKDSKAIQKAFDISFTDPAKNKTPEVKAMQEAMKEHKTNHEAGHDINNPAEQKVQEASQGGGPQLHQRPGIPLNATSNTQNVVPAGAQPKAATVPGNQTSSTPYAKQFLDKQPLELSANPQAAAYKAQADKQQAEAAKIIPELLRAETAKQVKILGEQNSNARADARNFNLYKENSEKMQNQLKMQGMRDNAAYSRVVRQGADAMARAQLHAETALGVSNDPRIKGTPLEKQLQMKALTQLQTDISKETSDLVKMQNEYETQMRMPPEKGHEQEHKETLEKMHNLIQYDSWNLQQLVDNRQKFTERAFGIPSPSYNQSQQNAQPTNQAPQLDKTWTNQDPSKGTHFIAAGATNGNVTKSTQPDAKPESVGNDYSDESIPPEDADINPDEYDQ